MSGAPPDPAATVTVASPLPATAVGAGGVPGNGRNGVTLDDGDDAEEVPPAFVAVAVNVYGVPLVSPVTVHDVPGAVTVHVAPPGLAVTVYVAGGPPDPGATVTVACLSPASAVGAGGVPGAARNGVTELDAADADEVPCVLVAVAVKVYGVPLVRPVTVHEVAGTVTVHVAPPGLAVTAYVTGVPPEPAATVTVAWPLPATAVGAGGVPGGTASAPLHIAPVVFPDIATNRPAP